MSDLEFLIAFHSNFLSGIHGFRGYEVLLQDGHEFIVILKERHTFLTAAVHINLLATMHGFRDNEVLLPTGYDGNVSFPPDVATGDLTNSRRATMTS